MEKGVTFLVANSCNSIVRTMDFFPISLLVETCVLRTLGYASHKEQHALKTSGKNPEIATTAAQQASLDVLIDRNPTCEGLKPFSLLKGHQKQAKRPRDNRLYRMPSRTTTRFSASASKNSVCTQYYAYAQDLETLDVSLYVIHGSAQCCISEDKFGTTLKQ